MASRSESSSSSSTKNPIRSLLGLGYCVQGFRCFPWMAVSFFLKDALAADSSTLQIIQTSVNFPMVGKPLYGIVSDAVYLRGQHRVPYIAAGAFLQAVSWLAIGIQSSSSISILYVIIFLLLSNLGASIAEVANDAIVAEMGSHSTSSSSSSPELQSFVWIASGLGGVLGNLLGGIAVDRTSPQAMFVIFSIVLTLQCISTININESSLNLSKRSHKLGVKKQLSELSIALQKPEIKLSVAWLAASYTIIPTLAGTMFFFQTQHLKIDSSIIGISKVFGQGAILLWGIIYNRYLQSVPARELMVSIQATMALLMVSDSLFVMGIYRNIGIPDSLYVVVFSGLLEVMFFFKILPFNVLVAQLCPPGCEGSLMALVASAIALALIVSGYLGVVLSSFVGVTGSDFSGFPRGLLIQAACTLVPLYWAYCIPDQQRPRRGRLMKKD